MTKMTEIEVLQAALLAHPSVDACAVLARKTHEGANVIVAYVVPAGPVAPDALRGHVGKVASDLPVPDFFVPISSLPLTSEGRIDEAALERIEVVDDGLAQRWEGALRALPELGSAAVLTDEFVAVRPSLHLSDLLPGWKLSVAKEVAPAKDARRRPADEPHPGKARRRALSDGGPLVIPPEAPRTLTDAFLQTARRHGKKGMIYVSADGTETFRSYAELEVAARRILAGLQAAGLRPGGRAILQVDDLPDHFAAFWACVLGGITPVTVAVAPSYAEAGGVVNKLHNAWKLLEHPRIIASGHLAGPLRGLKRFFPDMELEILAVDELKTHSPSAALHASQPDDLVFFQLTSGSTGLPKCIQESHRSIISHIHGSQQFNGYTADDVCLNWLPLDHVVPILTCHLKDVYLGCQEIQVKPDWVLADPLHWLDLLARHRVTHTWAPNFGFKLVSERHAASSDHRWDLSAIKFFMNAAEQVTLPVVRQFLECVAPFGVAAGAMQPAFGMAEVCTCMTYTNDFSFTTSVHRFLKSSLGGVLEPCAQDDASTVAFIDLGPPIPGVQIRITNAANEVLPEGMIGRLHIKGDVLTRAYLNNEPANREAFVGDGWFNSGDLGFILNGRLTLTGREKEMIIIRGANFYCYEIEDVVNNVPGIEPTFTGSCAVDDPATGTEALAIFFVPQPADFGEQAHLVHAVRTEVTSKLGINPAFVIPLAKADFPKTTSGKIQRGQLKKRFEAGEFDAALKRVDVLTANSNTVPDWFFRRVWRRQEIGDASSLPQPGYVLLFLDESGLGARLGAEFDRLEQPWMGVSAAAAFVKTGPRTYQIDPRNAAHYGQLLGAFSQEGVALGHIVHLWTVDDRRDGLSSREVLGDAQDRGVYSLLALTRACATALPATSQARLFIVSSQSQATADGEDALPEKALALGLTRTISQELPNLDARHVDLSGVDKAANAALLLRELGSRGPREVAYRNGQRLVPLLDRLDLQNQPKVDPPFKPRGFYLISGGLGGVGVEVAKHLLKFHQARLLLVGRTPMPERSQWPALLAQGGGAAERIRTLQALEPLGEVAYEATDICDLGQLRHAVDRAKARWQCDLDGILHLAGAYHDRLLAEETPESFAEVLRPKVAGTWTLYQLVKQNPQALFIGFSSVLSQFGGAMIGAYSTANRFLETFVQHQRVNGLPRSYCFAWSTWGDTGMSRGYAGKDALRAKGILDMSPEQAIHSLLAGLCAGQTELLVGLDAANLIIRRQSTEPSEPLQRLCAYVTAQNGAVPRDRLAELELRDPFGTRTRCEFRQLPELPITAEGTIDRRQLAELSRRRGQAERVAPRTELESQLAAVWQDVLGASLPGVHDNFFQLGGHSLLATQVLVRVRAALGVEVPLRTLFEGPTIAKLAEAITAFRGAGAVVAAPALCPVPRGGDLPLSFAQQRLWFIDQLEPGGSSYNTPTAFRLTGSLNKSALEQSLRAIVQRHEVLRTTYPAAGGRPAQVIAPKTSLTLPVVNLQNLPATQRESEALRLANEEARKPFDLANGPLFRGTLLRLDDQDHFLLMTMHHIVSDGWSLGVMNRELTELYASFAAGLPSPLPPLPIQYADFGTWQRNRLQGELVDRELAYWKQQLEGVPRLLELPTDRPRPPAQTYRGTHFNFTLSAGLSTQLKALCQQEGVTLFMLLMAAFQTLMRRYSGQEKLIVSTAVANRNQRELEPLIGCLINVLLLRADFGGNPTFREFLEQARETALGAYAHQELPFEQLVEKLQPQRDLSYNPLTQVMLVMLNAAMDPPQLSGVRVAPVDVESAATQYDLALHLYETADGLAGYVDYSTDLFDGGTMRRLLAQYEELLKGIVAQPEQRVLGLPLLPERERHQLLVEWNATQLLFPAHLCVHEVFEQQAMAAPNAVAVVFEGRSLTYAELNQRANQLARRLRQLGVGPDVLVGHCVERSLEMVVGVLGIMKAGGAYVPLDPAYPVERVAFMLADAEAPVLLTQKSLAGAMPAAAARVVFLDSDWVSIAQESSENLPPAARPENLAYVIYTSGSTGQPKGVQIPHLAVVNFLESMRQRPGLQRSDVLLAVTTLSFDIAGLELYLPLTTGATVFIASREVASDGARLIHALSESRATVMQATPATWRMLYDAGWPGDRRLKILCGGEALPRALARRLLETCGPFWNVYGPTETTIWSTLNEITAADGPILIGRPIANTTIRLLDERLQLTPIGVPGELHIGGAGLARGYRKRPELTAEKFIRDPFSTEANARLYKTGDLARYRADGNLEFLSRLDFQVKIRGFRIELGEIEAALGSHPDLREAVVVAREDMAGEKRLVAYIIPCAETAPMNSELRSFLKQKLPENMVPSAFVRLEAFPLTPNGKVDRKRLPPPDDVRPELEEAFVAPRTPEEEVLAGIFAQLLSVEQVGVRDSFFELGGHSLLATQVISRIRETFQVEVPLRSLFEAPTVIGLSAAIQGVRELGQAHAIPPLRPVPREGDLPLSFAQQRLWFIDQLEPGSPSYNIPTAYRLAGKLNFEALERSVSEIVRRHEALRTNFRADSGRARQLIGQAKPWKLPRTDLRELPEAERSLAARRLSVEEARRPFDLAQGPLLRVTLLEISDEENVLLVTMHHIVADGWSLGVFNRELASLYQSFCAGTPALLAELPIQYADYAVWQRNWLQGEVLANQLSYWKQQFDGVPHLLELPSDRPRPPVQSYRGAHQSFRLSEELSHKLKALSRKEGTTLFMTLMAAFKVLLGRYSGQEQFIISTGIANRTRPETESLIGCLINILLLKADLSGNPSFREFLGREREIAIGAYAHPDLPFERLVEELQPKRDLSYNPLTQVMFVLLNEALDHLELAGLKVDPVDVESVTSQYDLVMHLWDTPDGLSGFWHYSTDLFDPSTIARMLGHFQGLLEGIVAEPGKRILDLPLLTEAERRMMLCDWNDTRTDFPREKCLHELFELQVEKAPEATALIFGEERLSYRQLNCRANQLGNYLRGLGVGPDLLVGICVERSIEMVVGILGIMKAGGAYVPLDPAYPQERLNFMLEDAQATIVLTQERLVPTLSAVRGRLICLDSAWDAIATESIENPMSGVSSDNLSYVIFTSGSTGTPKGIAIFHRGVLNNIVDLNWRHGVGQRDRMLCLSSLSFDMCVYEVFGTLEAGGALVMPQPSELREPARWAELVKQHQVTIWNSAPALLKMFVDYVTGRPDLWPGQLHLAILGGDWIPVTLPDRLKAMAPGLRFIALGGATEASIHSIIFQVDKTDPKWKSIPYGKPQYNQKAYILNPCLQPAPIGVAGELYLGGIGLARGYFNRPDQTVERFLPNPYSEYPGERIYRTGDLARYLPDGNIELIGRVDFQVKLRGLRIECGEIESVIRQHPAVREAVVAAKEYGGDKRLVAYIRPRPETALPVCQLLGFQKQGLLKELHHGELPNGMAVIFRNKAEIAFGFKEIFEDQGYLQHGITLRDGDVIFDVGANVGLFALNAATRCKDPIIYAFEPIPPVFEVMKLNTSLYGLNVKSFNYGLSRAERTETFTYHPRLPFLSRKFASGVADRETVKAWLINEEKINPDEGRLDELVTERLRTETVPCPVKTLSQVIREQKIDHVDLLKIGVDKSELDVIAGIEPQDWRKIRQLVVEVYEQDGRLERILEVLRGRGYEVATEEAAVLKDMSYRKVFAIRRDRAEDTRPTTCDALPRWRSPERLINDVREYLKGKLPDYMVPSAFKLMEELPLSPNGKIDRKALPTPDAVQVKSDQAYQAPRNATEETLAGIVASVLGSPRVGVHDSFFDLGGHSLLATQVISRIREVFRVELPLRSIFEAPTVAGLAQTIQSTQEPAPELQAPPLVPVPRAGDLPLSFGQQRLWFLDQLLPGSAAYNIAPAFSLKGPLHAAALEQAFREIVRRHEALRTVFPTVDDQPVQRVMPPDFFGWKVVDLAGGAAAQSETEARRLADEEAQLAFDIAKGPLLRVTLIRVAPEHHLLLMTMPHIVSDGWSLAVFCQELSALYGAFCAGQPSPLPELPIQFADYAVWKRNWLQGKVLEEQLGYWKQQLAEVPTKIELPSDHPRPPVQTLRGARYFLNFPTALAEATAALGREEETTLFMTLLAAFNTFLYTVGSPGTELEFAL